MIAEILVPTVVLVAVLAVRAHYRSIVWHTVEDAQRLPAPLGIADGLDLDEAPEAPINESTARVIPNAKAPSSHGAEKLHFATVRAEHRKTSPAKWRLSVRFLLLNGGDRTVVLDDIHARIYKRNTRTPAFLTISYRGDVLLVRDNCMHREPGTYSISPGDGFEINLILNVTRIEGAPLYGVDDAIDRPLLSVFGLVVDYYTLGTDRIAHRGHVRSDCIYAFQYDGVASQIQALDRPRISALKARHAQNKAMVSLSMELEETLEDHLHPAREGGSRSRQTDRTSRDPA